MYGENNHCAMLRATTMMPRITKSNTPAKLKRTVNTKVDKPKITAKVPTIERRSFQRPMIPFTTFHWKQTGTYKPYEKKRKERSLDSRFCSVALGLVPPPLFEAPALCGSKPSIVFCIDWLIGSKNDGS